MKYSVIDISSNSISLIIADIDGKAPRDAEIIFKQRENLSLLTYLEDANLSARGIEKLTEAIASAKNVCKNMGVCRIYLIATAVMRGVANADEVEKALLEKTGMTINYIDGTTEAYCDYIANEYFAAIEGAVLVDIGGKSIELCDLSKTDRQDMLCLDFGILDLRDKFVKKIQPNESEGDDIKKYVKERFNKASLPKEGVYNAIVLAGPVCNAVYDVYREYFGEDAEDGEHVIERKKFKKMTEFLLTNSNRSGLILKAAPEKLALIAPAAVVLRNLFKRFDVANVIVSERGVKEGYLKLILNGEKGEFFEFAPAAEGKAAEKSAAPRTRRRTRKTAAKTAKPAADVKEQTEPEKADELLNAAEDAPVTLEQSEEAQTQAAETAEQCPDESAAAETENAAAVQAVENEEGGNGGEESENTAEGDTDGQPQE